MFVNGEEKTADFMYASLAGNNCFMQWYVASLLILQQLAKKDLSKGGGRSAQLECQHAAINFLHEPD